MRTFIKSFIFIVTLSLGSSAFAQMQTYRVVFESNWNAMDHLGAPRNAHFSPIVAVTHNSAYDLLPLGGLANMALELVAELGRTELINDEIMGQIQMGNVLDAKNTENMFIRNQVRQEFMVTVSMAHPNLSFVTMIAPSPDWIVGVRNLKLFDNQQGFFMGQVMRMPLYAIDAGTESGDMGGNFSINNPPTVPQTPIKRLRGPGFEVPFAFVSIEPVL